MSRTRDLCNGKGHPGGTKNYRVCQRCGERKAATAFRVLDADCMKCSRLCRICGTRRAGKRDSRCDHCRKGPQEKFVTGVSHQWVQETRVPFDAWMRWIRATVADHRAVSEAVGRYGLKSPCPDDIIEAYAGGNSQLYGQLFHATVLLAHEQARLGRMGTDNLGTPRRRRATPTEQRAVPKTGTEERAA